MRLDDLIMRETGTYVAVKPVGATAQMVGAWMQRSGLPNLVTLDSLHVTVLYSRKAIRVTNRGDEYQAAPAGWKLFPNTDGTTSLVLLLDSPGLTRRHSELIRQGATHDYASYEPHLTVTYDFRGDWTGGLEPIGHGLLFGKEYSEALRE